jgi:hypothetical protein
MGHLQNASTILSIALKLIKRVQAPRMVVVDAMGYLHNAVKDTIKVTTSYTRVHAHDTGGAGLRGGRPAVERVRRRRRAGAGAGGRAVPLLRDRAGPSQGSAALSLCAPVRSPYTGFTARSGASKSGATTRRNPRSSRAPATTRRPWPPSWTRGRRRASWRPATRMPRSATQGSARRTTTWASRGCRGGSTSRRWRCARRRSARAMSTRPSSATTSAAASACSGMARGSGQGLVLAPLEQKSAGLCSPATTAVGTSSVLAR